MQKHTEEYNEVVVTAKELANTISAATIRVAAWPPGKAAGIIVNYDLENAIGPRRTPNDRFYYARKV